MVKLHGSMGRKLVKLSGAMLLVLASSWVAQPAAALPPGCVLEHNTETRSVIEADKPVRQEKRTCGRQVSCQKSYNNTDWVCGDWQPG